MPDTMTGRISISVRRGEKKLNSDQCVGPRDRTVTLLFECLDIATGSGLISIEVWLPPLVF